MTSIILLRVAKKIVNKVSLLGREGEYITTLTYMSADNPNSIRRFRRVSQV